MGVKLVLSAFLLAAYVLIYVEAKPTDGWKILENESEDEYKARCLLLLMAANKMAGQYATQQQYLPQQTIGYPQGGYYETDYLYGPQYGYESYYPQEYEEFIPLTVYQYPDGTCYYLCPTPDGSYVEVIYPNELFLQTEFRNLNVKNGSWPKEGAEGRIKRKAVLDYEARKEREQVSKTIQPSPAVRPPPNVQIRPQQQVQFAQQPSATQQQQQKRVVVSSKNQIPPGVTVYAVKRT